MEYFYGTESITLIDHMNSPEETGGVHVFVGDPDEVVMKTKGDPVLCLPPEEEDGKPCVGYVSLFISLLAQLLIAEGTKVRVVSKDKMTNTLARMLCLKANEDLPHPGSKRPKYFALPWGNL